MEKEQHAVHCKNSWMASNEWENEQQFNAEHVTNNTSVLIQERARLNVSKTRTICSYMVVFWANVMSEQWQINNLIS